MQFVLIHGGWQGGWCWDGVVSQLEAYGHETWAPTLRGSEAGPVERSGVTLQEMANRLIVPLLEYDLHEVVLVGHSGGGPVIQLLADRLETPVHRLVFVSGWVLLDGEALIDLLPQAAKDALIASAARTTDATVPVDPELWKQVFMQDGTPEQWAAVLPRLVPYPIGWLTQPIRLPRFFNLSLPASYIFLRQDQAAPKETYQRMAGRLSHPKRVVCNGSHEAIFTKPTELAEALLAAGS